MLSSIVFPFDAKDERFERIEGGGWGAGESLKVSVRFDQVVSELCVDCFVPADIGFEFVDAAS
jgi:hypothetical protein